MTPFYESEDGIVIFNGDCLATLPLLPENSVDALVTDPPAGISFMNKKWDDFRRARNSADVQRDSVFGRTSARGPEYARRSRDAFVEFMTAVMSECYRVMKPGAHGLVWSIPRTSHWTAWAMEDAGFEVRDRVSHLFGSGFPKSLNVSKALSGSSGIPLCTCPVPKPCYTIAYDQTDNNGRDAQDSGNNVRYGTGATERISGMHDPQMAHQTKSPVLPKHPGSSKNELRELSESDCSKEQGVPPISESFLRDRLRQSISKEKRQRNLAIWQGVEAGADGGSSERQGVSSLSEAAEGATASSSSLGAISNGRSKPAKQLDITVPLVSQQDREDNGESDFSTRNASRVKRQDIDDRYLCAECNGILSDIAGTALKPACEDWWLVRKPLEGTVVQNILKWGVGGLNIDDCRIGTEVETWPASRSYAPGQIQPGGKGETQLTGPPPPGRWPANIVLSHSPDCRQIGSRRVASEGHWPATRGAGNLFEGHAGQDDLPERCAVDVVGIWECEDGCAVRRLNKQSGDCKAGGNLSGDEPSRTGDLGTVAYGKFNDRRQWESYADDGGASRFFFCPKASVQDREEQLEDLTAKQCDESRQEGSPGGNNPRNRGLALRKNTHPTVKNSELMRYLVRLITPPGGTVLDCFAGSGSTGKACALEGFKAILIEKEVEYCEIAARRCRIAQRSLFHA